VDQPEPDDGAGDSEPLVAAMRAAMWGGKSTPAKQPGVYGDLYVAEAATVPLHDAAPPKCAMGSGSDRERRPSRLEELPVSASPSLTCTKVFLIRTGRTAGGAMGFGC